MFYAVRAEESESVVAATELDFALASFWKFARIWKVGKNCKLTLTCNQGQGEVHLVAGLGAADEQHLPLDGLRSQKYRRKKTPSQLRREERRRDERNAVQARDAESGEKSDNLINVSVEADEASNVTNESGKKETEVDDQSKTVNIAEIAKEVTDEICPDRNYDLEEIDPYEAARDRMIAKSLVCPVGFSSVEKDAIENEIRQKFEEIGVTVIQIDTKRSFLGEYKGSIVFTSLVNLNRIWGRRLGITNCSIIAFDPQ